MWGTLVLISVILLSLDSGCGYTTLKRDRAPGSHATQHKTLDQPDDTGTIELPDSLRIADWQGTGSCFGGIMGGPEYDFKFKHDHTWVLESGEITILGE